MNVILKSMSMLFLSSAVFAAPDIVYEGTTTHSIARTTSKPLAPKSVTLLKVRLSDPVIEVIQKKITQKTVSPRHSTLPPSVQLGMNHVPVLDQGVHGTCATFALTAALDAMKGIGDYYSELCSLNLGKYLEANGYGESGWNGQNFSQLLARIDEFGLVSKKDQRTHGCGDVTEYPVNQVDHSSPMSLEAFHAISAEGHSSNLSVWSTILDFKKWVSKEIPSARILEQTKQSLYYGNRIAIGMLLPLSSNFIDNLGLSGEYHTKNDTWVITGPLKQEIKLMLLEKSNLWIGHAMLITGYDDNAVAFDEEGLAHKGLFTLRNSWGSDVGDHGNFYVSYDYFSTLALELEELLKITH
jgi:hypothetical protein